jgi:hypothetical protein
MGEPKAKIDQRAASESDGFHFVQPILRVALTLRHFYRTIPSRIGEQPTHEDHLPKVHSREDE